MNCWKPTLPVTCHCCNTLMTDKCWLRKKKQKKTHNTQGLWVTQLGNTIVKRDLKYDCYLLKVEWRMKEWNPSTNNMNVTVYTPDLLRHPYFTPPCSRTYMHLMKQHVYLLQIQVCTCSHVYLCTCPHSQKCWKPSVSYICLYKHTSICPLYVLISCLSFSSWFHLSTVSRFVSSFVSSFVSVLWHPCTPCYAVFYRKQVRVTPIVSSKLCLDSWVCFQWGTLAEVWTVKWKVVK